MAEVRPKMSCGVEEEAIMGILFGEEIKCLGSDGFEGSEEERRICMTVLYEVNISNFGNALSKIGNSQSKECSLNKQPGYPNTENLVHANPHSLNDTLVNNSGHVELNNNNVNDVLGLKRHRLQSMTTSNNTNAKRLKMSSSDPFQIKELVTTITKNGNELLDCRTLQKSNSSTAPSSVTAHPRQQCSQSHNVSFNASRIDSPVLTKETTSSSMNATNQKDKLGSFYVFGDGIWRALPFKESDKIAGGSYFKPTDTSCNTYGRNEELGVVRQQSRNNSGNTSNFFIADPVHEHPAVGKKMLLFHPKKISKLGPIENNTKGLTSEVSDANCIYLFPNSINHRKKDFSAGVCALQDVENSLSTRVDKRSDEALPPDPLNSKEEDEIEKAKLCESNGGTENFHSISEDGVVFLETQHNKSFDEVLIPDPGSSLKVGEVKKTRLCKKRGRKKQHSVEITNGSSQEVGEVRKTVVCKKRRKEQTA